MTAKNSARAVADLTAGRILASVEIAAPPERVFKALTSSEDVVRWWGSDDDYRTTDWVADVRPGGRWRADGKSNDGSTFHVEGEYLEVVPSRRLVQTWKPVWDEGRSTTLTYQLEAIETGTRLTVLHEGFSGRPDSCRNHSLGWEKVLAWLDKHLDPSTASHFFCRLLPPRPSFMQDMNAEEAALMGAHAKYWAGKFQEGAAVVYGPVADPKGGWGLGVIRAADEAAVHAFEAGDPVIRSGRGFRYEILPMPRAIFRS